ncbi:hypothetical protein EVJ58_g5835 [Rhodofomes roseus]|uniref:Uncharacterized protein n=1 Tax=Rhodofomes roseus TaxID=34475 RepID=A0A4Y9YA09_9APHY|nr:hypothetical protein EVJ58_g5835 [Rhodofomes roseus]
MDSTNASGLTPNETKSLKERSPEPYEEKILKGIKELYSCKPSEETYKIYTEDAVFHDPIGIAEGLKSIRAQFNGLVKVRHPSRHPSDCVRARTAHAHASIQVFPRADVKQFRVLQNPPSVPKSTILVDQDVAYYRDPNGSPTKTNERHLVTKHTEEWDHKRETSREDGFVGLLNEQRKRMTAGITGMFVSQEPPAGKTSN